ncbi:MAG: AraC family transcriptional regulator [Coprococcus sp.]
MKLYELCKTITVSQNRELSPEHRMGSRLVCPEYSKSAQEVKTYPLIDRERIFAVCWYIAAGETVHATMYPSPEPFAYRLHYTTDLKTQLHTHDYIELAYVVDGEFRQRILGKDIVFSKGDLCLIDKNCLHQDYLLNQSAVILFLGIANDMFSEIMDENITTQKISSFLQSALLKQKDLQQYIHFKPSNDADQLLENYLCQLLQELIEAQAGTHYIRKGLLLRIFHTLSTRYEFALSKEQRKTMQWIVFEEISDYIEKHYKTITTQELSAVFHFQEDYFNRLIKSKTGLTYSAYVQQIRLSKAEHLLQTTDKTVEEIAEIVGYHNRGFFYKLFRQKYGVAPAEFRKVST